MLNQNARTGHGLNKTTPKYLSEANAFSKQDREFEKKLIGEFREQRAAQIQV